MIFPRCRERIAPYIGCGICRNGAGVGIFWIPAGKDALSTKTREAWSNIITKDRVVDENLRRQIKKWDVVCLREALQERGI